MRTIFIAVLFVAACGGSQRSGNGGDDDDSGGCVIGSSTCPDCDPAAGNACMGNDVVMCNADGTFGTPVMSCGAAQMCSAGACSDACTADGVDLIYAVDEDQNFLSFDPRLLPGNPFVKVGVLNCPHSGTSIFQPPGPVIPMSMSVDRNGVGWVEYTSGEIFNVAITTAVCTKTSYVPQSAGMALFGMGFVTDTPGANTEKLYIAGGGHSADPNGKLAMIDTTVMPPTPTVVGNITGNSDNSPELTGTNMAQLYGFFPRLNQNSYVQEVDRTSGASIGPMFPGAGFSINPNGDFSIRDWAFAQWGGKFYVFASTDVDGNNTNIKNRVFEIDKAGNTVTTVIPTSMFRVDGAGVSTCAPAVIE
jgi:hypothetical protein